MRRVRFTNNQNMQRVMDLEQCQLLNFGILADFELLQRYVSSPAAPG